MSIVAGNVCADGSILDTSSVGVGVCADGSIPDTSSPASLCGAVDGAGAACCPLFVFCWFVFCGLVLEGISAQPVIRINVLSIRAEMIFLNIII